MRVETAPRMLPTSGAPLHATPRHARGSWEAQRAKSLTTVKTAPPARSPFWAWPNNVSRLCVAQARGLLSVYKKRGTLLYPFTCARVVRPAPTVTPSRTGEVSQGKTEAQDDQSNTKTTKSRGTKQVPRQDPCRGQPQQPRQDPCRGSLSSPGKALAGAARPTPTERATLEPTVSNITLGQGSGGTSMVACRSL